MAFCPLLVCVENKNIEMPYMWGFMCEGWMLYEKMPCRVSSYLLIILCSMAGNYLISFFMEKCTGPRCHKIGLAAGLALNIGLLGYFKYYDFFVENINAVLRTDFADGTILFAIGMIKKVLLADTLALFVNEGFAKVWWLDTPSAWLVALCFAFELYFDFCGYCDMAVGIGKMFRFELPVNFKSPYKAYSVPEYWQRWHYTLTRFLQTYIYMPLAVKGMRKKDKKIKKVYGILAPMITFLVSGFWHGASWTFVFWGFLWGVATVWAHRSF